MTLPSPATMHARAHIMAATRHFFDNARFLEVETPAMVRSPGMEIHLIALETACTSPEGRRRELYLHTSPEYAMKRLLGAGYERIFQICKVFRDGEGGPTHNPEFTMLEWYRANATTEEIMDDCEGLLRACAQAAGCGLRFTYGDRPVDLESPFERLTVAEAFRRHAGLDIECHPTAAELLSAARAAGFNFPPEAAETYTWDDVFFKVFLEAVEPQLGRERPTFLTAYPAHMAALARVDPENPAVADRFELYIAGLELANAFGELTDPAEQRRRFEQEQRERAAAGRPVYPIDERLLEALATMPPSGGIALGMDRLVMLLTDRQEIGEVVFFPIKDED